jgi:hypothetical protein
VGDAVSKPQREIWTAKDEAREEKRRKRAKREEK